MTCAKNGNNKCITNIVIPQHVKPVNMSCVGCGCGGAELTKKTTCEVIIIANIDIGLVLVIELSFPGSIIKQDTLYLNSPKEHNLRLGIRSLAVVIEIFH